MSQLFMAVFILETHYPSRTKLGKRCLVRLVLRLVVRLVKDYLSISLVRLLRGAKADSSSRARLYTRRTTRRRTRRTKRCLPKSVPDG